MANWKKIATIGGITVFGGAAAFATGGLLAPLVGGALGSAAGFSGAAATAHGLAVLGGGALAAGGGGMAAGTAAVTTAAVVTGAAGTGVAAKVVSDHLEISELKTVSRDASRRERAAHTALSAAEKRIAALEADRRELKRQISALKKDASADSRTMTRLATRLKAVDAELDTLRS